MEFERELARELTILEEIERDPDTTQADLATRLGVAVGTVNWHVKRLVAKGYVKVKRAERRKLRYIITSEGLSLRARLTVAYVENSMELYRRTRETAASLVQQAKDHDCEAVRIVGDGEIAEVCRLTCLEMGMPVTLAPAGGRVGMLEVDGLKVRLRLETPNERVHSATGERAAQRKETAVHG
jgi:DNA-binding MarR family transcriptional regulator